MLKVIISSNNEFILIEGESVIHSKSKFIENYKKVSQELTRKNEWKMKGFSAMFRDETSVLQHLHTEKEIPAMINSLVWNKKNQCLLYSAGIESSAGIFEKNPYNVDESEGRIVQDMVSGITLVDINDVNQDIVVSTSNDYLNRNISIIKSGTSHISNLTEGDTIDENPSWSRFEDNVVYYDTAGIGRDQQGNLMGFSERTINRLNLNTKDVDELVCEEGFDCICPKTDRNGSLYYLKRPHKANNHFSITIIDILLIPIKLIKAIFSFLEFFTMRYTGQTFMTKGNNPSKMKMHDPKQLFIEGNIIKAEEEMKQNKKAGEKYPGIIPRSWELVKKQKDGLHKIIKKGVLSYDVDMDGKIVYSNGKNVISIDENGNEELLYKADLIKNICILR